MIRPDGKAKVFEVPMYNGTISDMWFISLELRRKGKLISDNFYWVSR